MGSWLFTTYCTTVLLLIHFPILHHELAPHPLPQGLRFLDPGLHEEPVNTVYWRPDGLPLPPRDARKYVEESLRFGGQFASPAELAFFAKTRMEDFYSGSVHEIRSELTSRIKTESLPGKCDAARLKGQMLLLLNWAFEERLLELARLEERVHSGWEQFDTSLGIEPDEADIELPLWSKAKSSHFSDDLPWARLVPAFLSLLPEETLLFVGVEEVIQAWKEAGIKFQAVDSNENENFQCTFERGEQVPLLRSRIHGWKLAGLNGPEVDTSPGMDREWTIYGIAPDHTVLTTT